MWRLTSRRGVAPGIGGTVAISVLPPALAPRYSGRTARSYGVFAMSRRRVMRCKKGLTGSSERDGGHLLIDAGATGIALAVMLVVGCGGAADNAAPSRPPTSPSADPNYRWPLTATITLTPDGPQPSSVVINVGGRVTIVNNDSRAHENGVGSRGPAR